MSEEQITPYEGMGVRFKVSRHLSMALWINSAGGRTVVLEESLRFSICLAVR